MLLELQTCTTPCRKADADPVPAARPPPSRTTFLAPEENWSPPAEDLAEEEEGPGGEVAAVVVAWGAEGEGMEEESPGAMEEEKSLGRDDMMPDSAGECGRPVGRE